MKKNKIVYKLLIFLSFFGFLIGPEAFAGSLCTKMEQTKLRKGPGRKYPVTWTVAKYMPLLQIGKKGRWLNVKDVDGQKHWVHSSLVSSKISCLVVKSGYSNLYVGPGKTFAKAKLGVADKYTPFRDLGGEDGWHLIENGVGKETWVSASNVWRAVKVQFLNF